MDRISRKIAEMNRLSGTALFLTRITDPKDALYPLVAQYEDAIGAMEKVARVLDRVRADVQRTWRANGPKRQRFGDDEL